MGVRHVYPYVWQFLQVHRIYRLAGASFQKAQGEFARGVASNPHVQSAATEAAAAGVRNAMTGDNRKWRANQMIHRKLGN